MRKPSFTSIPINESIKPVSRKMEGGTKEGKYEGNHVFRHLKIFAKLKKKEQIEINLKNGNVFITGKN